jgi:hypothetical protein
MRAARRQDEVMFHGTGGYTFRAITSSHPAPTADPGGRNTLSRGARRHSRTRATQWHETPSCAARGSAGTGTLPAALQQGVDRRCVCRPAARACDARHTRIVRDDAAASHGTCLAGATRA